VRRALAITAAVLGAGLLVLLIEAPRRPTRQEAVRGPRVARIVPAAVTRLAVAIGDRRVAAVRNAGDAWTVAGRPATPPLADALNDLVDTLAGLRAVDRFRPSDGATFGFEPPRATIDVVAGGDETRLVLGELNAARSAVYARRPGRPHVLLVGLYLVSALERVLYFASLDAPPRSETRLQRPEIG
jgi:hypothetical protein